MKTCVPLEIFLFTAFQRETGGGGGRLYACMMNNWFAWNKYKRILAVPYAISGKLPIFMIADCIDLIHYALQYIPSA